MAIASKVYEKVARALVGLGLIIRTSGSSVLSQDPTITAGSGAPSEAEPNGSLYCRTTGAWYGRVGGAWSQFAVVGGTNDYVATVTAADELLNVDLSMNHATAQGIGVDATAVQLTTARTSGTMAAFAGATTSLAGDSGGTYADFWAKAPTDGGGSAIHVALLVSAGHDRLIDASAALTGQNVVYLPNNVASAMSWADSGGTLVTIVTTNGSRALAVAAQLTTTEGVSGGLTRRVGGRVSVATSSGTALTNSTTETVLSTVTVPSNHLNVGTKLRARGFVRTTAQNGTDTLTCRVRLGNTTLTGTAVIASAAVDQEVGDVFPFDVEFTFRNPPGADADFAVTAWYHDPDASGTAQKSAVALYDGSTGLNTSSNAFLEVTGQWSVADPGNSCRLEDLFVELVG